MKRIFTWLESKLSRPESRTFAEPPGKGGTATPGRVDLGIDLPTEIHDLVNDEAIPVDHLPKYPRESEMHAPMPDIYADEDVATVPDLKCVDPLDVDADASPGFNPYDTAELHKK